MNSIQKIFQLVRSQKSPCFIIPEQGEQALVVMTIEEYEKLRSDSKYDELAARMSDLARQTEELNQEIVAAQMEEYDVPDTNGPASEDEIDEGSAETVYIEPIRIDEGAI